MTSYIVTIDSESVSRLRRVSSELGRSIEDLIATAAEEAALEYAKSRGWPVGSTGHERWIAGSSTDPTQEAERLMGKRVQSQEKKP